MAATPGGRDVSEDRAAAKATEDQAAARRAAIRSLHAKSGRRFAVLDDDPTGSQSVHGVEVVTTFSDEELAAALADAGSTCFLLTNTRSEDARRASEITERLARQLMSLAAGIDAPIGLVSRSDSTLRGHVMAETETLARVRRDLTGTGYQATLFAPAYLEAGRFTEGDVHYARLQGIAVPVGETEFARDATFGYRSSNLVDFLFEASGGTLERSRIARLSLEEIRGGGADGVAATLRALQPGGFVVVNATTYEDLEEVALGVALAEADGLEFLARCGPSFVRALAGIEPRPPLGPVDVPAAPGPRSHGLVVVGSHVGLTNDQLAFARARRDFVEVELDPDSLAGGGTSVLVERLAGEVLAGLEHSTVLLSTSRTLRRAADPEESLAIARGVSEALVAVVGQARRARPAWVLAKGGITSHDVAAHALDIRRAAVVGQLLSGMVSLLRPLDAPEDVVGMPYVVFAGNVGDESTLDHAIGVLEGSL